MENSDETAANPKSRGLGRGLNALFEDDEGVYPQVDMEGQTPPGRTRIMAGIDQLEPGTAQPRHMFDSESIEELAESIKAHGLLQPILARKDKHREDMYEIIAGERRWRAAQKAGLHEVPVSVLDISDVEALEIALVENLQRQDLNPVDEAMGYQKLLEEYGHTQEALAGSLGKSRSHIANMVRLLSLPDVVLGFLERGDLTTGHARALITAKDPEGLARIVVQKKLNVRETERMAAGSHTDAPVQGTKTQKTKDVDTLALEADLSDKLGMKVSISTRNGKSGKLGIKFSSLDQLDALIAKLTG